MKLNLNYLIYLNNYAECRYAECHYAESHGTLDSTMLKLQIIVVLVKRDYRSIKNWNVFMESLARHICSV